MLGRECVSSHLGSLRSCITSLTSGNKHSVLTPSPAPPFQIQYDALHHPYVSWTRTTGSTKGDSLENSIKNYQQAWSSLLQRTCSHPERYFGFPNWAEILQSSINWHFKANGWREHACPQCDFEAFCDTKFQGKGYVTVVPRVLVQGRAHFTSMFAAGAPSSSASQSIINK